MNIYNVVADSATNFFSDNMEAMYIVYAVCHMFGMSSVIFLFYCSAHGGQISLRSHYTISLSLKKKVKQREFE